MGLIQGLTEFLPVSSSGHLEIFNALAGARDALDSDFTMVLLVHLGTALSIIWVYRDDIWNLIRKGLTPEMNEEKHFIGQIIISMMPALIIGLAFEDQIESLFEGGIIHVGIFLVITGMILWLTPNIGDQSQKMTWKLALLIGIAQAVAILPGISRSGMTIAAALMLGVGKKEAARFSFLMVLPVIFGKMLLDFLSGDFQLTADNTLPIIVALITSFVVGVLACQWMIRIVQKSQLRYFAIYCALAGLIVAISSWYG